MSKIMNQSELENMWQELGNLPEDYEPCGECGFDHNYEYESAYKWHSERTCQNEEDTGNEST